MICASWIEELGNSLPQILRQLVWVRSPAVLIAIFLMIISAPPPADSMPQGRLHISAINVDPTNVLPVLAPDGSSINRYINGGITDEHVTIFPPGTFRHFSGVYMFFVASRTSLTDGTGLVVLQGNLLNQPGPGIPVQWGADFANALGPSGASFDPALSYGLYDPQNPPGQTNGQIFTTAMNHDNCPSDLDQTFDLNYAAGGQVLFDPTVSSRANRSEKDAMLYVYEGSNRCVGIKGGSSSNYFYSTIGIATSSDRGLHWPTYNATPTFSFVQLPQQNAMQGPTAPTNGAFGSAVCFGNDCSKTLPATYGRYPVISPVVTIADAEPNPLTQAMGDSEPSAFIDNVSQAGPTGTATVPFIYVLHSYGPGSFTNNCEPQFGGIAVARAQFNGGTGPLSFTKWYGENEQVVPALQAQGVYPYRVVGSFNSQTAQACPGTSNAGLGTDGGGLESPIFPQDATNSAASYLTCQAGAQLQQMGSISYVPDTKEYLLTFVCSPVIIDPQTGQPQSGFAWFFSTLDATQYDLSAQGQWSAPQQVGGSFGAKSSANPCFYQGWYPSWMSLSKQSGYLATSGFVFAMQGCTGASTAREFVSWPFTIQVVRK